MSRINWIDKGSDNEDVDKESQSLFMSIEIDIKKLKGFGTNYHLSKSIIYLDY